LGASTARSLAAVWQEQSSCVAAAAAPHTLHTPAAEHWRGAGISRLRLANAGGGRPAGWWAAARQMAGGVGVAPVPAGRGGGGQSAGHEGSRGLHARKAALAGQRTVLGLQRRLPARAAAVARPRPQQLAQAEHPTGRQSRAPRPPDGRPPAAACPAFKRRSATCSSSLHSQLSVFTAAHQGQGRQGESRCPAVPVHRRPGAGAGNRRGCLPAACQGSTHAQRQTSRSWAHPCYRRQRSPQQAGRQWPARARVARAGGAHLQAQR